jgi:uncharacterized membrane protein
MHWRFLAAVVLAAVFYQLGALSVTVSVLSIALQGALLVVALIALAVGAAYIWRHVKGPDRG